MKLATWNCCGQFDTNLAHLLVLDVDVAVVCEAATPGKWPTRPDRRTVTGLGRRVWPESWKELAVVACEPWSVTRHEQAGSAPAWTLPVRVSGPTSFLLVALWPVRFPGTPDYVGQIEQAVDWVAQVDPDGPVVLAGDFNAPIASGQAQYDKVARQLEDLGLVDAYRASRGLFGGQPPDEATYYHHRCQDMPFNIDHVWGSAAWAEGAAVEAGDFETWIAAGRSDHVPVVVDLPVGR